MVGNLIINSNRKVPLEIGPNYKPVPPPKPKSYRTSSDGWGGYSTKGYDRGPYQSNGALSDDYSGFDSGQGSSLDRKYETLGRSSYSKVSFGKCSLIDFNRLFFFFPDI